MAFKTGLFKFGFLPAFACWLIFLDAVSCQGWVIPDEGCPTPDGGSGDCLPIKHCKPMTDFLRRLPMPLPARVRDKLNAYQCNFEDGQIFVCCPYGPIMMDVGTTTPEPAVRDWRSHKYFDRLPKSCGYLSDGDKIKNGLNTTLNEFPWMALLNYRSRKNPLFKCGATIINDRWILTAAHCLKNLRDPLVSVRVGEHNIKTSIDCQLQKNGMNKCNPPVQDLNVEKIIPHPGFNADFTDNDIGLVKVSRMNLLKENVRPVCLPTDPDITPESFQDGVVTGWGVTETGGTSNLLLKVELPFADLKQCQRVYAPQKNAIITDRQMCAGGTEDKDSCPGDSGGPLQVAAYLNDEVRYVQMGVVSFGPMACGLRGSPGVYTKVSHYLGWILDTVGKN